MTSISASKKYQLTLSLTKDLQLFELLWHEDLMRLRSHSIAHARPAKPAPTMTTFIPLESAGATFAYPRPGFVLIAFIAASWTPSRYAGRVLEPRRWARLVIVASIAVSTTAYHSNEEPDQVAAYYIYLAKDARMEALPKLSLHWTQTFTLTLLTSRPTTAPDSRARPPTVREWYSRE